MECRTIEDTERLENGAVQTVGARGVGECEPRLALSRALLIAFFFALLSFLSMLGSLKEHRKNSIRAARFAGLNGGKLRLILLGSMASRTPTRLKARRQSLDDL